MHAGQTAAQQERDPTFNDRLNKASDSLQFQCERIEAVLARVNGTPQKVDPKSAVTPIKPQMSLGNVVESLEAINQRLADLATGIERIA